MQGTVTGGSNNVFLVECEDGVVRRCGIKGKKLKASECYYNPLAPGDVVIVEADGFDDECARVLDLVPRKNEFVRWNIKGRSPQLLAANLDYLVCVTTPGSPPFRPRFVDRMLIQADSSHIEPLIVCNKSDLPFSPVTERRFAEWERLGYTVLKVSAKTGDGLDRLAGKLAGKLSAFAGQSGVGKSRIIHALDPGLMLRTGSLSEKYGKGVHTTTQGTLFHLDTGAFAAVGSAVGMFPQTSVIDTPGVRRFVLHDVDGEDLICYFRELEPLVGTCRYGMSCSHETENGCAVLEAVRSGTVMEDRYESWLRIRRELTEGTWED